MKAIIEIELEIDGEWNGDADRQELIDLIFAHPEHGLWEIDERLCVLVKSMTVTIEEGKDG